MADLQRHLDFHFVEYFHPMISAQIAVKVHLPEVPKRAGTTMWSESLTEHEPPCLPSQTQDHFVFVRLHWRVPLLNGSPLAYGVLLQFEHSMRPFFEDAPFPLLLGVIVPPAPVVVSFVQVCLRGHSFRTVWEDLCGTAKFEYVR